MSRIVAGFLPPIALDAASTVSMGDQLSEWFRRAILDGRLQAGQRVPSTRSLARELGVSRAPVLDAYEQLFAEGYLETFVGAGTCVARSMPGRGLKAAAGRARSSQAVGANGPRRIAARVEALRPAAQTWANTLGAFRMGVPALDRFPLTTWSRLVGRHARRPPAAQLVYGDPMGYLPLREAIAGYLGAVRAVRCDAERILITTGSQQGLQICANVLLDAGARVWVEDPGYPGARQACRTVGAELVPVPVDREGIDVDEGIRRCSDARAAYITPSHQFPLGCTMSAARRLQLLGWAARSGAWIVEDDYDSEYRFGGRPIAALQGMDADDRVFYVGTFSKVMFPAVRIGYVVIPRDLVTACARMRDAFDTFSLTLLQMALNDFIREGHFARHIRRMRTLYAERRTALLEAVGTYAGDRFEPVGTDAGMQLTVLLPPGVDDVAVSVAASRLGIAARPLSISYMRPPARGGLVLGYANVDARQIRDGVRKLVTCL